MSQYTPIQVDSSIAVMMGRGLSSDLAQRIQTHFSDWESLCAVDTSQLAAYFSPEEIDVIRRARSRREIPRETVNRLINECGFRCCICWNFDSDVGVIIHHIRAHATAPDDRYENLIVLCTEHHSKVHTKWELARHPYPPELLVRRKEEFAAAFAAFKAGKRVAPGREKNIETAALLSPPLPPPHFLGRVDLSRDVATALGSQNRRVAIIGMGGVGKTALALKTVDEFRKEFPGGVLWTEVGADFTVLPEIVRAWLRSLGHHLDGMEIDEQLGLLSVVLTKRVADHGPLVLLVDDIRESVINDLIKLTSHVPREVSILITTREVTVGAAIGATQFRLEPLERQHSRQLLETISSSSLVGKEEVSVDKLLSLLGDLPLAVELVARQIAVRQNKPGFSIAELCRRLESFDPQILSFPGHRGIALSFALSYEHLDENEQQLFRSFAVFASTTLDAASVSTVCERNREETEFALDRLVLISLLNWGAGAADYRIHPLLHKYAEFLFSKCGEAERNSTRARFYQHYTATAVTTAKTDPANLKAIEDILLNLMSSVECAFETGDHRAVLETMLSLCAGMSFFMARNLESKSITLLEMAITAASV